MCASITETAWVAWSTWTRPTWEKLPGKSLPRAINAEVGAPPRETRMSTERTGTPGPRGPGRRRGLGGAGLERNDAVRMLQHRLLDRGPAAVERAVEPDPRAPLAQVPAARLPLDRRAQPARERLIAAQQRRTRRGLGGLGEESRLERIGPRVIRAGGAPGQGIGFRFEGRDAPRGRGHDSIAAPAPSLGVPRLQRVPQRIRVPGEFAGGGGNRGIRRRRGGFRRGDREDEKAGCKDAEAGRGPSHPDR